MHDNNNSIQFLYLSACQNRVAITGERLKYKEQKLD
jgi:hypothetical protein